MTTGKNYAVFGSMAPQTSRNLGTVRARETGNREALTPIDLLALLAARPPRSMERHNPPLSDRIAYWVYDNAQELGISNPRTMMEDTRFVSDFVPLLSHAQAGDDIGRAAGSGNWGELALSGLGLLPGGKYAGKALEKGGTEAKKSIQRIAGGAIEPTENVASRALTIYDYPVVNRPFSADYPKRATADEAGKLLTDIDGRPFNADARFVAGRRVVGDAEEALGPQELVAFGEAGTGRRIETVAPSEIRGDVGRVTINRYTREPEQIYLSNKISTEQFGRVAGHEAGHVLDQILKQLPLPKGKALQELKHVYNQGNNADLAQALSRGLDVEKNPRRVYKGVTPEAFRYKPDQVPREYWAEAFRAYMTSPGWFKSAAPEAAAIIRKHVNSHPKLKNLIQFNSLVAGGGLLGAPTAGALATDEAESAQ